MRTSPSSSKDLTDVRLIDKKSAKMNAFRAFLISSVNDRKSLRRLSLSLCVKRQTDHENRKLDEKKKEEWIPEWMQ